MTTKFKWTEENTAALENIATIEDITSVAGALGTSERSVASKLRSLGKEVPSKPVKPKTFTEDEEAMLRNYVEANAGVFTYAEIAEKFQAGKFTAKQIQGKILALELTGSVAKTVKAAAVRTYSADAEDKYVALAASGASIEDIAAALDVTVNSARGKALSLVREGRIEAIPHTAVKKEAAGRGDIFANVDVAGSTVAQLVEITGKTERGIKTMLTRRDIACADYTPKKKKEVAE